MPKQETTYRLFIASPGDVKDERDLIENLVHTINREHRDVSLVPIRWEHDVPDFNIDDTQARINEDLARCDVMVAIFGDKLGTPTARAIGGAVEEVSTFNRQIILYLQKENEHRLMAELSQYVLNPENRTWRTYSNREDLEHQASSDIRLWLNTQKQSPMPEVSSIRNTVFIEQQFPVEEIGIESVRERAVVMDLPPLFAVHVWWARRPLVASSAALLGSLLPAWSPDLEDKIPGKDALETTDSYRSWFLRMCGVLGDPVAAKNQINIAKAEGRTTKGNAYGYKQAYKNSPSLDDLALLHQLLEVQWGATPNVLDPTAGGGSIPFQAIRYRLPSHANDLNSVAAAVLRAGVELPARYGEEIVSDLEHWGGVLVERLEARLAPFFESDPSLDPARTYIWARTVKCPRTGKTVPLVSDWSLRRGDNPVAVRLVTMRNGEELEQPEFELCEGLEIDFDPKLAATWNRGKAVSPWDNQAIDGGYVRAEAQAGRMGDELYAVAFGSGKDHGFRAPTVKDVEALAAAEAEFDRLMPQWEADDVLPTEPIPHGNDKRPHHYGMLRWQDMFTDRQLLVHGSFVEEYRKISAEVRASYADDKGRAEAILALIALMQAKAIDFNSRQASWHIARQQIRNTFSQHAFPFRSTFAEFEGTSELFRWILHRQIVRAMRGIYRLVDPHSDSQQLLQGNTSIPNLSQITISQGDAGNLSDIASGSQTLICMDPPYYDNVMYAELADFFYVWEKRSLGTVWPELFGEDLTNKHNEAVANPTLFAAEGRGAKEKANSDYAQKMGAIFKECNRVLSDNGVLTVMFTHKRVDAWDSLGTALLESGFTIETSWPVRTEAEQSLHQARSNSAASTIFLVCRKRFTLDDALFSRTTYLDEIETEIRDCAGEAYNRSFGQGLRGVDLLLSTYGPALSVLSRHWPVFSEEADEEGNSKPLNPEQALGVARTEVTKRIRNRVVGPQSVDLDAATDFTVLSWELFKAREMPYDDARRLALTVGTLELDELVRDKIITAKGGKVKICEPHQRVRSDGDDHLSGVNRSRRHFDVLIDAVHTALYIVDEDGPGNAKRWIDERNLATNQGFLDCLQALVNVIPRSKAKGEWNVPEAGLLDRLVSTYFPSIEVPPDPLEAVQDTLSSS